MQSYTFFQFLAITEIKYFFLIIWLPENVPKFVLLFNHQIFDLASKQKSKNLKVTCLGKSPELLNFLLHFNLLQKRTTNSIISTSNHLIIYLSLLLNTKPSSSGLSSGGCTTIASSQILTNRWTLFIFSKIIYLHGGI